MSKFFNIGGYIQKVWDSGEITCTCMWGTIQLSKYPDNPELRKDCKHIKKVREILKKKEDCKYIKKIKKSLRNG